MKHVQTLLLLLLFSFFTACDGNTAARKAARGEDFVPDPNRIFFLNTRAYDYAVAKMTASNTVFRHKDLAASEASLVPVILDRWMEDRAQLILETRQNKISPPKFKPFRLEVFLNEAWEVMPLNTPPTNGQISALNNYLLSSQELRIVSGMDTLVAFPENARAAAREVLNDYLRLVEYQ